MSTGPNLFTGPAGSCPDCGQATLIRLGSFVAKPKTKKWVASDELVHAIYQQIKDAAVKGGGYIKIKGEDGKPKKQYKIGKVVRCTRTKDCKKKDHASKYLWVALDGKIGESAQRLAGPFCGVCWPEYKHEFSHTDGMDFAFPVYYVITSFEALQPIFESDDPVPEEPEAKPDSLEVEGLF